MRSLRRCLVALALVGAAVGGGCGDRAASDQAADASVDPARKAALQKVWRESVRYRSAHLAYAGNAPGMAKDLIKARRMLDAVKGLDRMPVASDPAADARAVEAMVRAQLEVLKIAGGQISVKTRPAPAPAPARVSSAVGLQYAPAQIAGTHDVALTLPNGLVNGPLFFEHRGQMPRLFVVTAARIDGRGRAVIAGEVGFFRDLKPVRFYREPVDPDRLIAQAAGAPAATLRGPLKATAEKIRENYAQVEAVQAGLKKAYAHEARLKIDTGRFGFYSAAVDRFNGPTWAGLIRGGGGAGGRKP